MSNFDDYYGSGAGAGDSGNTGSSFDWGSLFKAAPGLISAGTGLYDLFSNSPTSAQGSLTAGAAAADPFGSQRSQYQPLLQRLVTNPGQITPQGQAAMDQGMQALERSGAAKGFLGSGNMLQELNKYATQTALGDYNNQFNQLALLSGATTGSPASAGQILAGRFGRRNDALANIGGGQAALGGAGGAGGGMSGGGGSGLGNLASIGSSLYKAYSGGSGGGGAAGGVGGSNPLSSVTNLFGGGSGAGVTTGGSELGAGSGGAFDQWAATQPGMGAGAAGGGIGAGETASTYGALGSDAGGYGGWGAAAGDAGEASAAGAGAGAAEGSAGAGAEAGAGAGALGALGAFGALAAFGYGNWHEPQTPEPQVLQKVMSQFGGPQGFLQQAQQSIQDAQQNGYGQSPGFQGIPITKLGNWMDGPSFQILQQSIGADKANQLKAQYLSTRQTLDSQAPSHTYEGGV